jgi:hypothetical protein
MKDEEELVGESVERNSDCIIIVVIVTIIIVNYLAVLCVDTSLD